MKINTRIFWANVRSLREDKGWSQVQISEKLDVNHRNYNNKERGFSTKLPMDLARKVAEVLETTVEELSQGEEPEEAMVDPVIVNFWSNVKARRERMELSQKAMAEKLGMSAQNFQTKEVGKAAKLPRDLALQVATALECTVDELMADNGAVTTGNDMATYFVKPLVPVEEQGRVVESVIEKPKETVVHGGSSYDMSHLPLFVQRFISNKANEDFITNMVDEQLYKMQG